jgi:cytochrome c oxidase subunit 1
MHILGLCGMTRRVYTYQPGLGWGRLNALATFGVVFIALSVLITIVNLLISRRSGAIAGANPWNADTLEWSISSPPPRYNYLHLPVVSGPNAIWDAAPDQPYVTGLRFDRREVLVTRTLDAEPDHREEMPEDSSWPFILAVTTTIGLAGSIFYAWYFSIGVILTGLAGIGWFWPSEEQVREELREDRHRTEQPAPAMGAAHE